VSIERARKAIRGEPTDRIPFFDTPLHPGFLRKLTGLDPFEHTAEAVVRAMVRLDIDMIMCGIPGPTGTRETDPNLYNVLPLGEWRNRESGRRDIFNYDPVRERSDLPGMTEDACVVEIRRRLSTDRDLVGGTALPIGYTFQTCVHFAAEDLDWETFLMACVLEEDRVDSLLDRFQAASEKVMRAHVRTDIEVMLSHEDLAAATGLLLSPDWIRRHLIPRYRELWRPFRERGIPLLFMSDGNYLEIASDIRQAGAEGFFLDRPCMELAAMAERCGRDAVHYTGPSPATVTTGTPADVTREVRELAEIARDLPRFFFHMPGGWVHTMPVANVQAFYDACCEYGSR